MFKYIVLQIPYIQSVSSREQRDSFLRTLRMPRILRLTTCKYSVRFTYSSSRSSCASMLHLV